MNNLRSVALSAVRAQAGRRAGFASHGLCDATPAAAWLWQGAAPAGLSRRALSAGSEGSSGKPAPSQEEILAVNFMMQKRLEALKAEQARVLQRQKTNEHFLGKLMEAGETKGAAPGPSSLSSSSPPLPAAGATLGGASSPATAASTAAAGADADWESLAILQQQALERRQTEQAAAAAAAAASRESSSAARSFSPPSSSSTSSAPIAAADIAALAAAAAASTPVSSGAGGNGAPRLDLAKKAPFEASPPQPPEQEPLKDINKLDVITDGAPLPDPRVYRTPEHKKLIAEFEQLRKKRVLKLRLIALGVGIMSFATLTYAAWKDGIFTPGLKDHKGNIIYLVDPVGDIQKARVAEALSHVPSSPSLSPSVSSAEAGTAAPAAAAGAAGTAGSASASAGDKKPVGAAATTALSHLGFGERAKLEDLVAGALQNDFKVVSMYRSPFAVEDESDDPATSGRRSSASGAATSSGLPAKETDYERALIRAHAKLVPTSTYNFKGYVAPRSASHAPDTDGLGPSPPSSPSPLPTPPTHSRSASAPKA